MDAAFHKCGFEAKGAAERERDEIVLPLVLDIGDLGGDLAVPPNAVAGQIGADVDIRPER